MVFFTEPFKIQKKHCRVKKEHNGNKHASYRQWREAIAKTVKTCFSPTLGTGHYLAGGGGRAANFAGRVTIF